MITILAEKPSQAQHYANALTEEKGIKFSRKDGFFESSNYIITWAFGHLVELADDTKYRREGVWSTEYLPLIPENFQYVIGTTNKKTDPGKKKQLNIIKECFEKADFIINGTDADREGELIFNYIYNFLNCKKPVKRLWLNSLTNKEIVKGFDSLKQTDQNFISSAYLRAILDWVIGVNGTQSATLTLGNGKLLTIGRVQTVMLRLICEKYLRNLNFKKEPFYKIRTFHTVNGINFYSESETFQNKAEAESLHISNQHKVKSYNVTQQKENQPLLYSINTLIIEANKYLQLKPEQVLELAQSLYEKKLISYPRTDNEYITEENYILLKSYLSQNAKQIGVNFTEYQLNPKSVNNKKVDSSHDAIVPTPELKNLNTLKENELNLYKLIVLKSLQAFSSEIHIKAKQTIVFDNNNIEFKSFSTKIEAEGWKKYLFNRNSENDNTSESEENKELPELQANQTINIQSKEVKEGFTTPPKLANTENLTKELTNAQNLIDENNLTLPQNFDLKEIQIGTQSTRALILKRLETLNFIQYSKKNYIPTELGLSYYQAIKDLQVTNYAFTIETEINLYKISNDLITTNEFMFSLNLLTNQVVNDILNKKGSTTVKTEKKSFGDCPKCNNGMILETPKAYSCSDYKNGCNFTIWKKTFGKTLTEKNVKDLLTKGITTEIKFYSEKKKSEYKAKLKLENNEIKLHF